jgi:hypothetical protein
MKPSTSPRPERKARLKARILSVRSSPVLGWTILGPSSPRTRRTVGLGTPRPIATSGQTGTKSTYAFRAATTLSGISSPE